MATIQELRSSQSRLISHATSDLNSLWSRVSDPVDARIELENVLPDLVQTYGSSSASISSDWYDELRGEMQISGRFRARPAMIEDSATDALARWATSSGSDMDTVLSLVEGGIERRIRNWGRQTIAQSSTEDPQAEGWQRTGSGACDFCEMLISRGAVYSEKTADFASHDNCECAAVPAFTGRSKPVKAYKPSVRHSQADQDRAREWIAANMK